MSESPKTQATPPAVGTDFTLDLVTEASDLDADVVVGAHGAALTNVVFCPPGASLVELFPPDYVNVCYWALTSAVGDVRYRYLVGDGHRARNRRMLGVASDITVDPAQVVRLVEELS